MLLGRSNSSAVSLSKGILYPTMPKFKQFSLLNLKSIKSKMAVKMNSMERGGSPARNKNNLKRSTAVVAGVKQANDLESVMSQVTMLSNRDEGRSSSTKGMSKERNTREDMT